MTLFPVSDFAQAAQMALGLTELGRQEASTRSQATTAPTSTAQTNYVHVIILDSLSGGEVVVDQCGSNARNLVGAD